jgi:beta-lactam-binding protein with PASTA domain
VQVILGPARAPISVPDTTGLTQAQACQALAAADLACSPITAPPSSVGVGQVFDQRPVSGSFVEPMTAVVITVSSGPQP